MFALMNKKQQEIELPVVGGRCTVRFFALISRNYADWRRAATITEGRGQQIRQRRRLELSSSTQNQNNKNRYKSRGGTHVSHQMLLLLCLKHRGGKEKVELQF